MAADQKKSCDITKGKCSSWRCSPCAVIWIVYGVLLLILSLMW